MVEGINKRYQMTDRAQVKNSLSKSNQKSEKPIETLSLLRTNKSMQAKK